MSDGSEEQDEGRTEESRHPGEPSEVGRREEAGGDAGVYPPGTDAPDDAEPRSPADMTEGARPTGEGEAGEDTTPPVIREAEGEEGAPPARRETPDVGETVENEAGEEEAS